MRVRILEDHSSTVGPKTAKHKGDEFTLKAEDAEPFIEAGLMEEVPAAKPSEKSK